MIAVDSSALIAVLLQEPDAQKYADALAEFEDILISTATYVETGIVLDNRQSPLVAQNLDLLIEKSRIVMAPVDIEQARAARQSYRIYGRRNHPASLNPGDCFAYALAKVTRRPLLYKGDDFSKTDIVSAL